MANILNIRDPNTGKFVGIEVLRGEQGYSFTGVRFNSTDVSGNNIYDIVTNNPSATPTQIIIPRGAKGEQGDGLHITHVGDTIPTSPSINDLFLYTGIDATPWFNSHLYAWDGTQWFDLGSITGGSGTSFIEWSEGTDGILITKNNGLTLNIPETIQSLVAIDGTRTTIITNTSTSSSSNLNINSSLINIISDSNFNITSGFNLNIIAGITCSIQSGSMINVTSATIINLNISSSNLILRKESLTTTGFESINLNNIPVLNNGIVIFDEDWSSLSIDSTNPPQQFKTITFPKSLGRPIKVECFGWLKYDYAYNISKIASFPIFAGYSNGSMLSSWFTLTNDSGASISEVVCNIYEITEDTDNWYYNFVVSQNNWYIRFLMKVYY